LIYIEGSARDASRLISYEVLCQANVTGGGTMTATEAIFLVRALTSLHALFLIMRSDRK